METENKIKLRQKRSLDTATVVGDNNTEEKRGYHCPCLLEIVPYGILRPLCFG